MALLSGCATQTLGNPPDYLLRDCVANTTPIRTNGDLLRRKADLEDALRLCNVDKAALRAWTKDK